MKKLKITDKSDEQEDEDNSGWNDNEWDNEISLNEKNFLKTNLLK